MLKTVSGKRDIGQCEVSRLLMSGPLYHSSFSYITQCLDFKASKEVVPITPLANDNDSATFANYMDEFAKRRHNKLLEPIIDRIDSLYNFVKHLKIFKGN